MKCELGGEVPLVPSESPPQVSSEKRKPPFKSSPFLLVPSNLETGQTNSGKSNGKEHCVSDSLACY